MKILLTGFDRFGTNEINSSELVVRHFAQKAGRTDQADLITEVLPTEFVKAGKRIAQLIQEFRPQRIICLGLAPGSKTIRLERVALNLDDGEPPDNAGEARKGKSIVDNGPRAYWSTLPLESLCAELNRSGISAVISNHAGTYVCNHVFYVARHEVELLGISAACGFIHLPPILEQKDDDSPAHGLPLNVMLDAVERCLRFK